MDAEDDKPGKPSDVQRELQYYRALVEHSADAIALLEPNGKIRFVTGAVEQSSGYTADEFIGLQPFEMIHPEDAPRARAAFQRALEEPGVPIAVEYRARHKDGSWRYREVVGVNRLDDPAIRAVIVNYRDTDARKRAEEALRQATEQLRQAQKVEALGHMAGGIAHDFSNLLTAIVGYSDLVLEGTPAHAPFRGDVEQIRIAAMSAIWLTRRLLAYSRRQILQPQVLDLNAIVSRTNGLLRRLIGEHIQLDFRLPAGLGRVTADPGQIEQVILNLALNGRDAMPQGGRLTFETGNVTLEDHHELRHPTATSSTHVLLAVSDTGVGMDEAIQARLFEPFFTTKEPGKGTGLGLATVSEIVKQSGGSISVYSEPGVGTTFKIFFPRSEEQLDALAPTDGQSPRVGGTETILVVEDQSDIRSLTVNLLARHGYSIIAARNGVEGLEAAARHPGQIHLLLTDVVMPRMSGPDVAEHLAQERPEIRVLYMSGYAESHHGVIEPGAGFIEKPFTPTALLQKVRLALEPADS